MKNLFIFICLFVLATNRVIAQPNMPLERQAELYMQNGDFVTAIALYDQLLKSDPNNVLYLTNRGWSKLNASSFTQGAEDLINAVKIDNACSRCYIGLAIFSMQNGFLDDALEQASLAVKSDDTASFNYFIRAQIYEAKGENYKAGKDFNTAIEKNPLVADYYYSRGNFLFRLGKYKDAVDDFSNALLLEPKVADFHFQRGYTYYMLKQFNYAEIDIQRAVRIDSTNADYWLGLGAIQEAMGNPNSALTSYSRTAALSPMNALAYFNRANIYFEKAMLDSSCVDYERCLKALGVARYPREDMRQEAQAMLINHCDTASPAYYYQRGLMAMELKQWQVAKKILIEGAAKWPEHPLINSFLGNTYLGLKNYEAAINAYNNALKKTDETPEDVRNSYTLQSNNVNPDLYMRQLYSSVYDGLSKCYLAIDKLPEAKESVEKAIFLAEKIQDAPVLPLKLMKANVLATMGEDQLAFALLEEIIKLNPDYASAYVVRARLLLKNAIATSNKRAKFSFATAPKSGMYYLQEPSRYKKTKVDQVMVNSALGDARIAIALNPDFAEAYFVIGQIKYFSGKSDYCQDFLKAKTLGLEDALDLFGKPCQE